MQKNNLKIGIITLFYRNYNYGGILQAFATQYLLNNMGIEAELIAYDNRLTIKEKVEKKGIAGIFKFFLRKINEYFVGQTKKERYIKKKEIEIEKDLKIRKKKFDEFMANMRFSGPFTNQTIETCLNLYSAFITGSDQVWNPDWGRDVYYLNFVPEIVPKIAYAASIGKNKLTKKELNYILPKIKRINYISVREKKAKELLRPYIGDEIKLVLDPTLLLQEKDWNEIIKESDNYEQYIFVYLLGDNFTHREIIKQYSENLNYKILYLPHMQLKYELADENFANINLYDIDPAEFLGLIKNAAMVITDSFHGSVFSIIYHKKFWALKRHKDNEKANMNSRLYSLFDNLGLEERLLDDDRKLTKEELLSEIDYNTVDEKLEILRKDSMDFLENALSESVKMLKKNQKKQKSKGN